MKTRVLASLSAITVAFAAQAQCSITFQQDTVTLYYGYDPLACATLTPVVNGEAPPQFLWSNGSSSPTIEVCDVASSWYTVTMTDDTLCVATNSVFVNVVDVRCGNGLKKVMVCHIPPGNPANARGICISENGVPAHLAHGCHLGDCVVQADSIVSSDEVELMINPNPMVTNATVTVRSTVAQRVQVRVVDAIGRVYLTLMDADMTANESRMLTLSEDRLPENPSYLMIEAVGTTARTSRPVIIER